MSKFILLALATVYWLIIVGKAWSAPTSSLSSSDLNLFQLLDDDKLFLDLLGSRDSDDYDLHYDQRQKGNRNVHLKLDNFVIGLPIPEKTNEMANELLGNLMLMGRNGNSDENSNSKIKEESNAPTHSSPMVYGVNSDRVKLPADFNRPETVVVAIPAPKKDTEPRLLRDAIVNTDADSNANLSRKNHVYKFFNLLRRSRRD